ncbi:MAG: 50S ribosomal protein L10 [Alphaproteobacteria bacterium]
MDKVRKQEFVSELHKTLNTASVVLIAQNSGLTVADMNELRNGMREVGAVVKVTKNRLTKIALKETPVSGLDEFLKGPTVIAYSDNPISAPKAAVKFAKDNEKFVVLGASMSGTMLNPNEIKSLANLPSLDELRGTIIGLITSPAASIARIVNAPGSQVARVINAYSDKNQAA